MLEQWKETSRICAQKQNNMHRIQRAVLTVVQQLGTMIHFVRVWYLDWRRDMAGFDRPRTFIQPNTAKTRADHAKYDKQCEHGRGPRATDENFIVVRCTIARNDPRIFFPFPYFFDTNARISTDRSAAME